MVGEEAGPPVIVTTEPRLVAPATLKLPEIWALLPTVRPPVIEASPDNIRVTVYLKRACLRTTCLYLLDISTA